MALERNDNQKGGDLEGGNATDEVLASSPSVLGRNRSGRGWACSM